MEENIRNFGYKLISNKEKYQKTNSKIEAIFKDYFSLINSFSYELNYIENIVNSYLPKKNFNFKKFLENQHLLIKELIDIINNLLSKIQFNTNKSNSFNRNSIKTIIRYNNTNINYLKKNTKPNDENNSLSINLTTNNNTNNSCINQENNKQLNIKEKIKFNGDLSFLNIPYKKRKKYHQYINKRQGNINNKNNICKSSSETNIISYKNKNYININHSFISNSELNKTNNNSTFLYKGITSYNSKENRKKKNIVKKYNSSDKNLLLNTSSFFTNIKDNYKYNHSKTNRCKSKNNYDFYSVNNGDIKINKNKTPIQITDYSSNRIYIATSTFNDSTSENIILHKYKYKNICNNLRAKIKKNNKIYNLKKYETISQYQITPNRMTKEVYNISYSILNKYENMLKKKTSLGKRSKSLLI